MAEEVLEYVGFTEREAALMRCLIYPAIKGYPIAGPDGEAFQITGHGVETLWNILQRFEAISLPALDSNE